MMQVVDLTNNVVTDMDPGDNSSVFTVWDGTAPDTECAGAAATSLNCTTIPGTFVWEIRQRASIRDPSVLTENYTGF